MKKEYKTQEEQEREFLQRHSEVVLYSQGKEAKLTYTKGSMGPAIMIFLSDTAEGYKLDIRTMDEGPIPVCVGQLEILLDRHLKNPVIKKP